ncbi:MAG: SDR family oxidoreductase [Halobacteriales archaeon]|nr:SDR family oxidoreductase [Halobacteriales archaeon]
MTPNTALITGASSGIGAELAKLFAADGDDLVLVARREDRLQELADTMEDRHGITATVVPMDLTEPDAARKLFEEVEDEGIEVHTLVNNAGFTTFGRFDTTEIESEVKMIDLNITAVTRLTKAFVQPMVERGDGEILNTSSMAGIAPTPTQSVYAATKSYILSFSESVGHELEGEGITVTALCPGPVDTEFLELEGMENSGVGDGSLNDPESVAKAGYNGLKKGKRVVIPSMKMRSLAQLKRVLPRRTVVSMAEDAVTED